MDEECQRTARRWFQFRLASLFWMTLVVAAFLLGRGPRNVWLDLQGYFADNPAMVVLNPGGTTIVTGNSAIPRVQIDDPDACTVNPLNDTQIQLVARQVGDTEVTIWYQGQEQPRTIEVKVRP